MKPLIQFRSIGLNQQALFHQWVLIIMAFWLITSIYGQTPTFEMKTICTFLDGASKVKVADMDGDGDLDVVVAGYRANEINWYEAPAWTPHHIVENWNSAVFFDIADMDSDNDLDVVASTYVNDIVAWFENPGWTRHNIDINLDGASGVAAVDMDGDDTLDVVVAGWYAKEVLWYEAPNWGEHIIDPQVFSGTSSQAPEQVYVLDIDGDQDLDVICTTGDEYTWDIGSIIWYFDPDSNWHKQVVESTLSWTCAMAFADLDKDGDLDAVATGATTNKIVWYDLPDWNNPQNIDPSIGVPLGVDVGDLDKDGNLDVVGAGQVYPNPLRWYKGPNWEQEILYQASDNMHSVCISDLDGDGDLDIVVTIIELNKVVWFENKWIINVPSDVPTIQAGIDSARNGDIVLVEDGIYYENINFKGKAITVASHFIMDGDTNHINNTVINGSSPSHPDSGSVVYFVSGEDTNSVLKGFTITGGTGTYVDFGAWQEYHGGGIWVYLSGAKIVHNHIINNHISTYTSRNACGGGILAYGEDVIVIIEDNIIKNNSVYSSGKTGMGGGAVLSTDNRIRFRRNLVEDNEAEGVYSLGGGLNVSGGNWSVGSCNGEIEISQNWIKNNEAIGGTGAIIPNGGGGMYIDMISPEIYNNLISGNTAPCGAGVLVLYHTRYGSVTGLTKPRIINNTITKNQANRGGGIYTFSDTQGTTNLDAFVMNCILWGDTDTLDGSEIYRNNDWGIINVVYSDVQGGYTGEGNISKEPMLRGENFILSDSSSCIGAGIAEYTYGSTLISCPPTCMMGNPRPDPPGSLPDMGACESPLPFPVVGLRSPLANNIPVTYDLKQNYPNPFNPVTSIQFDLPRTSQVTLKIFDILGAEVATLVSKQLPAGSYSYEWDGSDVATGIYLYRLEAEKYVETRKMVLIQ